MILVGVAPSGELFTLTPVYFRSEQEPLDVVTKYRIFIESAEVKPAGYVMEHSQGGQIFSPSILDLVQVIGYL